MKTTKCKRCKRRYRPGAKDVDYWNVYLDRGVAQYVLCPKCQTVGEDLEAKITEALEGRTLLLNNLAVATVRTTP